MRKVVFLIHDATLWDSLHDVYMKLRDDPHYFPIAITISRAHRNHLVSDDQAAHSGLQEFDIPHMRFGNSNAPDFLKFVDVFDPTLIFRQTPWDDDIPPIFSSANLAKWKTCYIPYYALQLVEDHSPTRQETNLHTDSPFHRSCWRIFVENDFVKSEYTKTSLLKGENVFVTGHPKLTRMKRLASSIGHWPLKNREPNRTARPYRVVWAPHHSLSQEWLGFGLFMESYKFMLEWARDDQEKDFILRPHPLLKVSISDIRNEIEQESIRNFFDHWSKLDNTYIDYSADYSKLFAASDILITDGISFLASYQIFDKPVIFLESPNHVPFNEIGRDALEGAYVVTSADEARVLVDYFARGGENNRQKHSEAFVKRILPPTDPADQILSIINEGLR